MRNIINTDKSRNVHKYAGGKKQQLATSIFFPPINSHVAQGISLNLLS